jgi:DNA transformation protein
MAVSDTFLEYVIEQIAGLGRVRSKRMFGAVGLYADELFFGLLDDNALYLKVDEVNREDFIARGMAPFRPFPDRPDYSMSYYQVPADVIEDAELLVRWARAAIKVAAAAPVRTKSAKASRSKRRPSR